MALGLNDFDVGKSITRTVGRGGPENLDILGPKWHSLSLLTFQGPKVLVFRAQALVMNMPTPKSLQYLYVPRHLNNRHINNYITAIETMMSIMVRCHTLR
jgi:hypothetical protein